jgi:hypothetical protein
MGESRRDVQLDVDDVGEGGIDAAFAVSRPTTPFSENEVDITGKYWQHLPQ